MNRVILRALNPFFFILIVSMGVSAQTALFGFYPLSYFQPDFVLLAVIWCGLKRDFSEGGILTLIFSHIAELHSSSPQGIYYSCYMFVYLAIRFSSRYFQISKNSHLIGLTFLSSISWKFIELLISTLLGSADRQWLDTLQHLFPGMITVSLLTVWILTRFERFDLVTFKDPRAKTIYDEEWGLEEEGMKI